MKYLPAKCYELSDENGGSKIISPTMKFYCQLKKNYSNAKDDLSNRPNPERAA